MTTRRFIADLSFARNQRSTDIDMRQPSVDFGDLASKVMMVGYLRNARAPARAALRLPQIWTSNVTLGVLSTYDGLLTCQTQ